MQTLFLLANFKSHNFLLLQLPPVLNCRTEDEIYDRLATLMDSNDELERIRKASRSWIEAYHSGNDLAEMQAQLFLSALTESRSRSDKQLLDSD